ncbi:diacylglycerol kinase [Campylobacter concisus]|uniref:diacylglycerol kinase n=1 Tax=Campylobacter concisus TaxID=199 RepID=UPI000CD90570|nr:diacylglycerol kinase [Campylobacter concisus]
MRNQPTYKFFKNFGYAREGLAEIFKNEKSFRIEICIFLVASISLFFWKFDLIFNLFLIFSMAFVLVCECLNSSLERVTDLASPDYHALAKAAKDAGSAAVMIANFLCGALWCVAVCYKIWS